MGDGLVFAFALADCGFQLFMAVYFLITLSDLECDYLNAASCCSRLNKLVLPELIGIGLTCIIFLFTWHWFVFLLNAPLLGILLYRYLHIPSGNIGMYDPTEIHNRRQLQTHMKECMAKTAYHVIFFFIYLYCLVYSLVVTSSAE
ncbi:protein cornichon homolog 4-like [Styela clava]|uniref:protein cornichon homolog 4-like n=1 Tax=Styela clava TaxID=7725 RepID=UPI00193987E0|nr:protein cornichon homolog 4-like [Styela clava]